MMTTPLPDAQRPLPACFVHPELSSTQPSNAVTAAATTGTALLVVYNPLSGGGRAEHWVAVDLPRLVREHGRNVRVDVRATAYKGSRWSGKLARRV